MKLFGSDRDRWSSHKSDVPSGIRGRLTDPPPRRSEEYHLGTTTHYLKHSFLPLACQDALTQQTYEDTT